MDTMRQGKGFTLLEFLIAAVIICVICAGVIPSIVQLTQRQRAQTTGNDFLHSILFARAQATVRQSRVAITFPGAGWESGWLTYVDNNKNGVRDSNELVLDEHTALDSHIAVYTGKTVRNYIGYDADGTAVHANHSFFADSLTFCAAQNSGGIRIQIWLSGRVRVEDVKPTESPCNA
jgi:type IV fimbrial biogenesis protein FimT